MITTKYKQPVTVKSTRAQTRAGLLAVNQCLANRARWPDSGDRRALEKFRDAIHAAREEGSAT